MNSLCAYLAELSYTFRRKVRYDTEAQARYYVGVLGDSVEENSDFVAAHVKAYLSKSSKTPVEEFYAGVDLRKSNLIATHGE